MPFRDHWRDVQSLHNDGIPIDTSSNETAKLFDMALTQYTGWYNDESSGGLDECINRLLRSDPTCAVARIFSTGLDLIGSSSPFSTLHSKAIESLGEIKSSNQYINYHRDALLYWSKGDFSRACHLWELCLVEYPFDMLAIKFVSDGYFFSGNLKMLRDSMSRVVPIWEQSKDRPLKSYLYGMYAFGLGENNMTERALKEARHGLELNPDDAWATHAVAHSLEYIGQSQEGISFLDSTQHQWTKSDMIKPHIHWHWALYELEQGNDEFAEHVLTDQFLRKENGFNQLDFVDATALIYRLKLYQNVKSERSLSKVLKNFVEEHLHDHSLLFNDLHMYFILNEKNYEEHRNDFVRTLKEIYGEADSDNGKFYRKIGRFIFDSIDEFEKKNYSKVVDLLYPIRNEIYRIGGSNAQRDLFVLLLIHAAVHSDENQHKLLAKQLINERSWLKNKTSSKLMENYSNLLFDH